MQLRTMVTLAQTKGSVQGVQTIPGHSKVDTSVNVFGEQRKVDASLRGNLPMRIERIWG